MSRRETAGRSACFNELMQGESDRPNDQPIGRWPMAMVAAAFVMAGLVFLLRLLGSDIPIRFEIAGAISIAAVMGVPPTLALLAIRGRRMLFLPASAIALVVAPILYLFGLVLIGAALVWFRTYVRVGTGAGVVRTLGTMLLIGALWFGAAASLFVHVDPVCVDWYADGRIVSIDTDQAGFYSGWVWNAPETTSGELIDDADIERSACSSDVHTPLEGFVSLVLAFGSVGAGVLAVSPSRQAHE